VYFLKADSAISEDSDLFSHGLEQTKKSAPLEHLIALTGRFFVFLISRLPESA